MNLGLVIASEGFQSGANEAITYTNVKLVTWQEFQDEFEQTWLKRYLYPTVAERCDPVLTYAEPFLPAWWEKMSDGDQQKYLELKDPARCVWLAYDELHDVHSNAAGQAACPVATSAASGTSATC